MGAPMQEQSAPLVPENAETPAPVPIINQDKISKPNVTTNSSAKQRPNNTSLIGAMTTWVPPTANITQNRAQLDIDITPPQSIAIVAGRKYIMVPKTNLMSVSPSGEVNIGDNNGITLPYVDDSIHPR